MAGITLFGLKSCDTCRHARRWLTDNGYAFNYHDVRADGLDRALLERWASKLDWQRLLNRRSLTWRKISEVDRAGMNEQRAIDAMLQHPTLVKRPVLEHDEFLAVGFSPDEYQTLLGG